VSKGRLEAFSDGVIAIIITIMVLELRAPHEPTAGALRPLLPHFLAYVLSFVYLGIYWNNHHHLFQVVREVSGGVLWANLHLLFWLSLFPFATAWMGENPAAALPVAVYGVPQIGAATAYWLLVRALLARHDRESALARAIGRDVKGRVSLLLYALALPLAFVATALAQALYAAVALVWFVPDRRIEKALAERAT
jgi:uncharacterized membrane protein